MFVVFAKLEKSRCCAQLALRSNFHGRVHKIDENTFLSPLLTGCCPIAKASILPLHLLWNHHFFAPLSKIAINVYPWPRQPLLARGPSEMNVCYSTAANQKRE